ncbi:MAG TPA: hypothetical protein PLS73_00540 [Saprospiraceae bacterium]|nr:hypothetical protein [Saprospiraceae bacterium]
MDISYLDDKYLLNHELLDFEQPSKINFKTGEISAQKRFIPEWIAKYKNWRFQINSNGRKYLKGSPHIYWNDGKHNYNNFDLTALIWVINDISQKFQIDPVQSSIHHLEIGLNLSDLPYDTSKIISNLMIHYGKGKPPQLFNLEEKQTPSHFKTIMRDWYKLKAYDKSKQYQLSIDIFRFEVKILKSKKLNELGIINLNDLLNSNFLKLLGELYLKIWDEVLINDWTIRENKLNPKELIKLKDWRNANEWINLYKETREKYRNRFSLELKRYKSVVLKHSENVHTMIGQAIAKSWSQNIQENESIQTIKVVQEHTNIIDDLALIRVNAQLGSENLEIAGARNCSLGTEKELLRKF